MGGRRPLARPPVAADRSEVATDLRRELPTGCATSGRAIVVAPPPARWLIITMEINLQFAGRLHRAQLALAGPKFKRSWPLNSAGFEFSAELNLPPPADRLANIFIWAQTSRRGRKANKWPLIRPRSGPVGGRIVGRPALELTTSNRLLPPAGCSQGRLNLATCCQSCSRSSSKPISAASCRPPVVGFRFRPCSGGGSLWSRASQDLQQVAAHGDRWSAIRSDLVGSNRIESSGIG